MRDILDQIRAGLKANLYYLSLFTALAIPDMCGAIDSDDGRSNVDKYADWYNKYVTSICPFLDGKQCYYFRCSLLHQGTTLPQDKRGIYTRILFVEPKASTNVLHCIVLNDALNIDVGIFCTGIIEGAEKWLTEVENTERFKHNFDKFVRRYPNGLSPYIVGVPVIG